MITDAQVLRLRRLVEQNKMSIKTAAVKAGMCETSAHTHLRSGTLPSESKRPHQHARTHLTRPDAFSGVKEECEGYLSGNPELEAKALFEHLQRRYPGQFTSSQLRTFQRRVKKWRGLQPKEIYFSQVYQPGDRAQSDFTCMNSLGITIQGAAFPHLLFHFVLAYSNWESVTVCESESFDALSAGLQHALYALNGVPNVHQTDSMSCAVKNHPGSERGSFRECYQALMDHYGIRPRHTQPGCPHENGKIEQRHHRLKRAIENQLILRDSRDFAHLEDYEYFLNQRVAELNATRQSKFDEERVVLKSLPAQRLDSCQRLQVRVSRGSTILVQKNHYSVPSSLIGQKVEVRVYARQIEVWYDQTRQQQMSRLHGAGKHRIHYRHVIGSLVRKPGAFANYHYRADLFPTHVFRRAYDALQRAHAIHADPMYLKILHLAAQESEVGVAAALEVLLADNASPTEEAIRALLDASQEHASGMDLGAYDALFASQPALEEVP